MNSTTFKPEEGGQLTSRVQTGNSFHICRANHSDLSAGLQRLPAAAAAAAKTGDTAATAAASISDSSPYYGLPATAYCLNKISAVVTVAAASAAAASIRGIGI